MSEAFLNFGGRVRDEVIAVPGGQVDRVAEPNSVAQVCEVVRGAATEGAGLLMAGGRTRLSLANPAGSIRLGLSLAALTGIDEFEPDEGVLHARAGTPLREIRVVVQEEGWELPLDSPGASATVGATIATAVTGPRAQAFGAVSDAILGLEVVSGEGVASKCGGRVVKNVTGYDMAKLYCGSFGSLSVVTGAWLRLRPVASTCLAYRAKVSNDRETFERVRKLASLASVRALVWSERPGSETGTVFVELGGSEEGVSHDAATFTSAFAFEGADPSEIDRLRDERAEVARQDEPIAIRVRVLGSRCEAMHRDLIGRGLRVSGDPGLGVLHARGRLDAPASLLAIRERAEAAGGFATFEQLPEEWRKGLDVFGVLGGTESIVASLKSKFDPAGILNPGRFVAEHEGGDPS